MIKSDKLLGKILEFHLHFCKKLEKAYLLSYLLIEFRSTTPAIQYRTLW